MTFLPCLTRTNSFVYTVKLACVPLTIDVIRVRFWECSFDELLKFRDNGVLALVVLVVGEREPGDVQCQVCELKQRGVEVAGIVGPHFLFERQNCVAKAGHRIQSVSGLVERISPYPKPPQNKLFWCFAVDHRERGAPFLGAFRAGRAINQ